MVKKFCKQIITFFQHTITDKIYLYLLIIACMCVYIYIYIYVCMTYIHIYIIHCMYNQNLKSKNYCLFSKFASFLVLFNLLVLIVFQINLVNM